jgi:hypothetical protein
MLLLCLLIGIPLGLVILVLAAVGAFVLWIFSTGFGADVPVQMLDERGQES